MKSTLMFEHHAIAVRMLNGTPHFCAADIAKACGYAGSIPTKPEDRVWVIENRRYIPATKVSQCLLRAKGKRRINSQRVVDIIEREFLHTDDIAKPENQTEPDWEGRLKAARRNAEEKNTPAFLDFCAEVFLFREHCTRCRGGSDFSRSGREWLGCSTTALYLWSNVGKRAKFLRKNMSNLPLSEYALCKISSLEDSIFTEVVKRVSPTMTQQQVNDLIAVYVPKRKRSDMEKLAGAYRKINSILSTMSQHEVFCVVGQCIQLLDPTGPYADFVSIYRHHNSQDLNNGEPT